MGELKVFDFHGAKVIDSREVAQMIEREHYELLKSIHIYIGYLNEGEIPAVDFFIESNYIDGKGDTRPCYLITKKGCDMVANKLTGKKGVLFTAAYVTAFEEMQQALAGGFHHIPEVSPAGLAKLILVSRRVMLDMGCSYIEIGVATKNIFETWGVPIPITFPKQIPEQLCLFDCNKSTK